MSSSLTGRTNYKEMSLQNTTSEEGRVNNPCYICGAELIWGGDHDLEDFEEDGHKIVTNLSCSNNNCNAYVEYYHGK